MENKAGLQEIITEGSKGRDTNRMQHGKREKRKVEKEEESKIPPYKILLVELASVNKITEPTSNPTRLELIGLAENIYSNCKQHTNRFKVKC